MKNDFAMKNGKEIMRKNDSMDGKLPHKDNRLPLIQIRVHCRRLQKKTL